MAYISPPKIRVLSPVASAVKHVQAKAPEAMSQVRRVLTNGKNMRISGTIEHEGIAGALAENIGAEIRRFKSVMTPEAVARRGRVRKP